LTCRSEISLFPPRPPTGLSFSRVCGGRPSPRSFTPEEPPTLFPRALVCWFFSLFSFLILFPYTFADAHQPLFWTECVGLFALRLPPARRLVPFSRDVATLAHEPSRFFPVSAPSSLREVPSDRARRASRGLSSLPLPEISFSSRKWSPGREKRPTPPSLQDDVAFGPAGFLRGRRELLSFFLRHLFSNARAYLFLLRKRGMIFPSEPK